MPAAPFSAVTGLVQTRPNRFAADVHPEWTIGGKPNGGDLLALLGPAAAAVRPHPPPIAARAHYPPAPPPADRPPLAGARPGRGPRGSAPSRRSAQLGADPPRAGRPGLRRGA